MKAILVIETDAEHIEDLYVEHIWNDCYPVELGKEVHFKPMPEKKVEEIQTSDNEYMSFPYNRGWNACLEEIEGE